jgi:integrase/recombinase XerD
LAVLLQVLSQVCKIFELEQVTVLHLRQCVQYVMSADYQDTHKGRWRTGSVLSVTTVRAYVRVWKVFFHWCYQEELIDLNPASRLVPPKPPTMVKPTFAPEHIEKMLASCDLSTPIG